MMLLPALFLSAFALPQVDLVLGPPVKRAVIGQVITVDLVARAAQPPTVETFTGLDAILSWDPAKLEFVQLVPSAYPWFISGFLPDPDGINLDLTDGEVLFTGLAPFSAPATVPGDLLVASFRFKLLGEGRLSLKASSGAFGFTRVLGTAPGEEITGDISSVVKVRARLRVVSNPKTATFSLGSSTVAGGSGATGPTQQGTPILLTARAIATDRLARIDYTPSAARLVLLEPGTQTALERRSIDEAIGLLARPVNLAFDPTGRFLAVTFALGSVIYDASTVEPLLLLPGKTVARGDSGSVWQAYATHGMHSLDAMASWAP